MKKIYYLSELGIAFNHLRGFLEVFNERKIGEWPEAMRNSICLGYLRGSIVTLLFYQPKGKFRSGPLRNDSADLVIRLVEPTHYNSKAVHQLGPYLEIAPRDCAFDVDVFFQNLKDQVFHHIMGITKPSSED